MAEEDVTIKFEGDVSGLLTALNSVTEALNNFKVDTGITTSATKGLNQAFRSSAVTLRFLRWGFIGASNMVRDMTNAVKGLWQPTEEVFGINAQLARFLSLEMSEALNSYIVEQNNVASDIQARSIPTIIFLTNSLTDLVEVYWDLPAPIKDFIGAMAGIVTILGEPLTAVLTFGSQVSMIMLGLKGMGVAFSLAWVIAFAKVIIVVGVVGAVIMGLLSIIEMFTGKSIEEFNWFQKIVASTGTITVTALQVIIEYFKYVGVTIAKWSYEASIKFEEFVKNIQVGIRDLLRAGEKVPLLGGLLGAGAGVMDEEINRTTSRINELKNIVGDLTLAQAEIRMSARDAVISGRNMWEKLWGEKAETPNVTSGGGSGATGEHDWINQNQNQSVMPTFNIFFNDSMIDRVQAVGVNT